MPREGHSFTGKPFEFGMLTRMDEGRDTEQARKALRDKFLENAVDARENGFDLLCAECGCGISDGLDMHDPWCSQDEDGQ